MIDTGYDTETHGWNSEDNKHSCTEGKSVIAMLPGLHLVRLVGKEQSLQLLT